MPRSYQVTPAVLERRRATTHDDVSPPGTTSDFGVSPTPSRTIHSTPPKHKAREPQPPTERDFYSYVGKIAHASGVGRQASGVGRQGVPRATRDPAASPSSA